MADELARWARERAPALRARAEAEAVAALRDALVAAALQERRGERAKPRPAAPRKPEGEGLWAYGILRGEVPPLPSGVGGRPVEPVAAAGLVALVSRVPLSEFGAEPLRQNLNDLAWLEEVARAHEAVLDTALAAATVVPLRLCTIYETERGVHEMLAREHKALVEALDALEGRQEWGVKVLVDRSALDREAAAGMPEPPRESTEGGAYLQRRRFERAVKERADGLALEVAEQVHARLQDWAVDAVTRPAQNRELSGHEGDMLLNGAYLVEADRVDELRELVADLQARHRALGVRIDLTGPWPPYNFVQGGDAAALA